MICRPLSPRLRRLQAGAAAGSLAHFVPAAAAEDVSEELSRAGIAFRTAEVRGPPWQHQADPSSPQRTRPAAAAARRLLRRSALSAAPHRPQFGYTTAIAADDRGLLEAYLQGCAALGGAGAPTISLEAMMRDPRVGQFLRAMRSWDRASYFFAQRCVIFIVEAPPPLQQAPPSGKGGGARGE